MEKQDKKILLAITKSNWGGAQKYVYTLANMLKNKGFLVKVLLGGNGVLKEKLESIDIEVLQAKSLQRDISFFGDIKSFFEILKILRNEKPDVFHLNSSKIGAIGAFAGRLSRIKKIIFTAHGFTFNEDRNPIMKFILKVIYWKTFVYSHKTIFVSKETKRQAPKFLIPSSKFKVIYNGIEPLNFYEKNIAREKLDLKQEETIVGTIAELHSIKNLVFLIEKFRKVNAKLVIIGEGEERKKLERLIDKNGLNKKVILKGFIEEAGQFLKAFNLFVLPSKSEAMPLSIIEAMQANIPIVASPVGGIPEMVPENCLFNEDLVQKITEQLQWKPSYNLDEFSPEKMTEKTILLYN
jgi:glycosyltransferase involved in cell wall biosynthesis